MRHRLLISLLAVGLLVPASAEGATSFVVNGAGWGHGIGMSQYGALGFARRGRDHREILAHYFRGTALSRADGRSVRVLLRSAPGEASFSGAASAGGRTLEPGATYRARAAGAGVEILSARGRAVGRSSGPLVVAAGGGALRLGGRALNGLDGSTYRGTLELRPGGGGLTVVNAVGLEDYVAGVVAGESPSSWPAEALRAQAIAARTYALATNRGGGVFDQYPDTRSQVYRGVAGERASTNAATRDTAGQVLTYGGRVIVAYFFSTSGGRTENVENVFYGSTPKPYLRSVISPYEASLAPRHRWRIRFSQVQMERRLRGLVKGRLRGVRVVERGASPRIVRASVRGTRGDTSVTGATLKARLGLHDTWAYFSSVSTRRAPRVRSSSWVASLVPEARAAGALTGRIEPSPSARPARLERRARGRWVRVRSVRATAGGSYRVAAPTPGLYRVRSGLSAGPQVRVSR